MQNWFYSATVRHAILGVFHDFVRIEWNHLGAAERDRTKVSVLELFCVLEGNDSKRLSRIVAEIAIREWPQMWPQFTEFIRQGGQAHQIHIIRACAEIQFQVRPSG